MNDGPARPSLLFGALPVLTALPGDVCPESAIFDHPIEVRNTLRGYADAGCDLLLAPTATANRTMLARFGAGRFVADYNRRLVTLAREEAGNCPVAGVLSTTGFPYDPTDPKDFDLLVRIYAEQSAALQESGVDAFVLWGMPSVAEARAAILACRIHDKAITVTLRINDSGEITDGASPLCALLALQYLGIDRFGFVCDEGFDSLETALRAVSPYAAVPLCAIASAGQPNPLIPTRYDTSPAMFASAMEKIAASGATVLGGSAGTTPEHLAALREITLPALPSTDPPEEFLLANDRDFFLLPRESIVLSDPIRCAYDMADAFLDAASEGVSALLIRVESPDEANDLGKNAVLSPLPLCISAADPTALDRALYLYQGRALIDSLCELPEETLLSAAKRYGAILY